MSCDKISYPMADSRHRIKNILNYFKNSRRMRQGLTCAVVLILLITIAGYVSHCTRQVPDSSSSHPPPTFEIYPREEITPFRRIPESPATLPKVAIIIDDIGYDRRIAKKFLSLDAALTLSVLPQSPFRKQILRRAKANGTQIMLHLPMEPIEYPGVNPGPGALLTAMSPEQISQRLRKHLDAMPSVRGVNNHMGSRMTAIPNKMYQILTVLKTRNLFFIDSFTTEESLCRSSARVLQVPFAQRDVFLDHVQTPDSIRRQIRRLIHIANDYGEAIGIGHPHTETYEVLRETLPELRKKVRLVPASELVHTIG